MRTKACVVKRGWQREGQLQLTIDETNSVTLVLTGGACIIDDEHIVACIKREYPDVFEFECCQGSTQVYVGRHAEMFARPEKLDDMSGKDGFLEGKPIDVAELEPVELPAVEKSPVVKRDLSVKKIGPRKVAVPKAKGRARRKKGK